MRLLPLTFLILFSIGCKKAHTLTMADLKFADYEREYIAKNGVDTCFYTYLYDTTFIHGILTDTVKTEAYNKDGNIIFYNDHNFFGTRLNYKYNPIGLVTEITGGSCVKRTTTYHYKLSNDSLLVYESHDKGKKDTTLSAYYVFDETGLLITSYNALPETQHIPFINTYVYNDDNRLVRINGVEKKTYKGFGNATYTKHIYYTGIKPDSSVAIYTHNTTEKGSGQTTKTYYNKLGLKIKKITPKGRAIYYKYNFRK